MQSWVVEKQNCTMSLNLKEKMINYIVTALSLYYMIAFLVNANKLTSASDKMYCVTTVGHRDRQTRVYFGNKY